MHSVFPRFMESLLSTSHFELCFKTEPNFSDITYGSFWRPPDNSSLLAAGDRHINYIELYFICVTYGLPYFSFRLFSLRFFFFSFSFVLFLFSLFCFRFYSFRFSLLFSLFSFRFFSFFYVYQFTGTHERQWIHL